MPDKLIDMTAPYHEVAASVSLPPALWFGVWDLGERFTTYRVTVEGEHCRIWCLHGDWNDLVCDGIDVLDWEVAERLVGDDEFCSFRVRDLYAALTYVTKQGTLVIRPWEGGSYPAHSWRYTGAAREGAGGPSAQTG